MKLTAEEIISAIKNEMAYLHNEIRVNSSILIGVKPPMSNEDYKQILELYENNRINHNKYQELQRLLDLIDAMESEKNETFNYLC